MRAFTPADIVQGDSGTATGSPASIALPGPTTEGNAGLIYLFAHTTVDAPAQWDRTVVGFTAGSFQLLCRADLPAGETGWALTSTLTPNWAWRVEELANVAFVPLDTSATNSGSPGDGSVSTGTTGTFTTQFVVGLAMFGLLGSGGSAWPTVSYSNGFVETDVVTVGTGTAAGDLWLSVARRYGTDSEAGPWECTATFTGTMTSKTPVAGMAVLRAAPQVLVDPGGVLT